MSRRLPLLVLAAVLLAPAGADAAYHHRHLPIASLATALTTESPETVVQDDATFLHTPPEKIAEALARTKALGIQRIRVTAGWSVIAPDPDASVKPAFDDTDPAAYPVGNWMNLDRIVRMAHDAGVEVMIDIAFWAPRWATRSPASETIRLRTDIDPVLYAHFAQAVARRYSGTWAPAPIPAGQPVPQPQPSPDGNWLDNLLGKKPAPAPPPPAPAVVAPPEPLPAVDIFTIWNEPNHPGFAQPIWAKENGRLVPHAADVYRAMVRDAYPAIKAAAPGARVLIGATSPAGATETGRSGVTPLRFIRRFACVDGRWRPIRTGACAGFTTIPGDGWSHHAYSLWTLPDQLPIDPDKLPVANTGRLLDALARLVRMGRLAPGNRDLYLTEYGYETSPPDPKVPFGPERQGQLLSWAEFIATRDPRVKMWPNFQLIDRPGTPAGPELRPFGDWQTGLYYEDWSPKPAAATYRTPTFAGCVRRHGRQEVLVWGRIRDRVPAAVALSRSVPGRSTTRTVAHVSAVASGREVLRFVAYRPGARYRLTWSVGGAVLAGPSVAPVRCSGR
ncbi:MAG: hypothetical protein JWM73_836 [Solirubrobacterales bacterium]|nr:hypothetical protein [Solirubrobacterales bacterium]